MHRRNHWFESALVAAGLSIAGCGATGFAGSGSDAPAKVEPIPGTQVHRVILSERAVERLGVKTVPVQQSRAATSNGGAASATTIPFPALLYDAQGQTWVFTSPTPDTYVRERVTVARVTAADTVELRSGPPAGTLVVTVGAPELLGTELGVGGE